MQMNTTMTAICEQFRHHCGWIKTVLTKHQIFRGHNCTGESDCCNSCCTEM